MASNICLIIVKQVMAIFSNPHPPPPSQLITCSLEGQHETQTRESARKLHSTVVFFFYLSSNYLIRSSEKKNYRVHSRHESSQIQVESANGQQQTPDFCVHKKDLILNL